jgi:diguanylate cyclase (GGDEF)-like protein
VSSDVGTRRVAASGRRTHVADREVAPLDQTMTDADQSAADDDQAASDADQASSVRDQQASDRDQAASDRDQAASDRDHASVTDRTSAGEKAYGETRDERASVATERFGNRLRRASTARDRDRNAGQRDRTAAERDIAGVEREARAAELARAVPDPDAALIQRLEELGLRAAADRRRAAADRARAATDRATAARERARLESELSLAHLDELTGAYRRQMGRLAISHEIDRARRGDGRFVLAFVDVDRLKEINDQHGHAAGDRVLKIVVGEIRSRLRSFDPIMRYGGDEFVCGLGGTDIVDAERRFGAIAAAIETHAGVGISVGFAALSRDESSDQLTERADAAMLAVKAVHHAGQPARA